MELLPSNINGTLKNGSVAHLKLAPPIGENNALTHYGHVLCDTGVVKKVSSSLHFA